MSEQPTTRVEPPERVIVRNTEGFWQAIDGGVFTLSHCLSCGSWSLRDEVCARCGRYERRWIPVSGLGVVGAVATFHNAYHPYWKDRLPYSVVTVMLDEGPWIITNIEDEDEDAIKAGDRVKMGIGQRGDFKIPVAARITATA